MTKFSNNLPSEIEYFFESYSNQLDLNSISTFQFSDLKNLSIIQLAKAKFYNFSKIMCGFLYAYELSENPVAYFEQVYEDLFEQLIQQWLNMLYSNELFEKIGSGVFIELPFYKKLGAFKKVFGQELQDILQSQKHISIIKLYKLWIKNLDKYYENLLTHSIDLLDSNIALDNLRKLND